MVGVLTSNRCDNCRRRKKKCDEQKPSCSECTRGGWICPGYTAHWKFVDETARMAEHYAGRKYIYESTDSQLEDTSSRPFDRSEKFGMTVLVGPGHLHHFRGSKRHYQQRIYAAQSIPRYHDPNPLGSRLVFCLESKVSENLIPLRFVGSFFEFVPVRLGRNVALDDAVSCLCAIYCSSHSTSNEVDKIIYRKYVKALSSLRSCLNDPTLVTEPETLCASILLQACEAFVNADIGQWDHLVQGTAFLMHARGVHRYQTAFEHAMLECQLSYILAQSLRIKEHCFLGKPEWQDLISKTSIWPYQQCQAQSLCWKSQLCAKLAHIPGLLADLSEVEERHKCHLRVEVQLEKLTRRVIELSKNIQTWLTTEAEPYFLFHTSSEQDIEQSIQYPDLISAVLDCVANVSLININKIIKLLHKLVAPDSISAQEVHQFLMSDQIFDNLETIERRNQRAIRAFNIVREESNVAAKLLAGCWRYSLAHGSNFSIGVE